jgi:hypothetical protein
MVGMVRSSAATRKFYLVPEDSENIPEMNFSEPYQGKLKLISENEIKYGITFSITTRTIRKFFDENRRQLTEQGYPPEGLFTPND